jgi:hypothetical protein
MLGRTTGKVNEKSWGRNWLLHLRVLGFGLLENGDVGVGVFPEREEFLVRRLDVLRPLALERF